MRSLARDDSEDALRGLISQDWEAFTRSPGCGGEATRPYLWCSLGKRELTLVLFFLLLKVLSLY